MCAVHNTTVSEQNVPPHIHAAGLSPCLNFFQMALYTVVSSELDVFLRIWAIVDRETRWTLLKIGGSLTIWA